MYISKAIVFNSKDLPIKKYELKQTKCIKCNKHSYQNYCSECGTKIENVTTISEDRMPAFDFLNYYNLCNNFDYEIFEREDDDRIIIFLDENDINDNFDFISLTDIKNFNIKDFENREEVKVLINLLNKLEIPYKIDIFVY